MANKEGIGKERPWSSQLMTRRNMTDEGKGKVTFSDENGEEIDFEHLATIEYEKNEYVVLIPYEELDNEEQGVIVLQITKDKEGNEIFCTIEDVEEQQKIFDIFRTKYSDKYNFS